MSILLQWVLFLVYLGVVAVATGSVFTFTPTT